MEKLKELIARVMGVDKKEIILNSSPDSITSWDSLSGLMLFSELEKNFDIEFTMEEIMIMQNVEDIKNVLEKHGVSDGLEI